MNAHVPRLLHELHVAQELLDVHVLVHVGEYVRGFELVRHYNFYRLLGEVPRIQIIYIFKAVRLIPAKRLVLASVFVEILIYNLAVALRTWQVEHYFISAVDRQLEVLIGTALQDVDIPPHDEILRNARSLP